MRADGYGLDCRRPALLLSGGAHQQAGRPAEPDIPAEDPDCGDLSQAFPPRPAPARDAILQPPKLEIQPSTRILERVQDHDLNMEAAN